MVVHPICQKTQFGQIHSDSLHFVTTLGDFQQTFYFHLLDYHQDQEGTAGISWALSNVNDCKMGYHDMVSKLEFQQNFCSWKTSSLGQHWDQFDEPGTDTWPEQHLPHKII